mmetsp:Transcript_27286/g.89084  ORF Transcript_27286/g.89084 Transcript_27286/m.89084 type:complete len:264 (-) Transcript_27286:1186-1977(-)
MLLHPLRQLPKSFPGIRSKSRDLRLDGAGGSLRLFPLALPPPRQLRVSVPQPSLLEDARVVQLDFPRVLPGGPRRGSLRAPGAPETEVGPHMFRVRPTPCRPSSGKHRPAAVASYLAAKLQLDLLSSAPEIAFQLLEVNDLVCCRLDLIEIFIGRDGGDRRTSRGARGFAVTKRSTCVPLSRCFPRPSRPEQVLDPLVPPGGRGGGGAATSSIGHEEHLDLSSWSVDANSKVIVELALEEKFLPSLPSPPIALHLTIAAPFAD